MENEEHSARGVPKIREAVVLSGARVARVRYHHVTRTTYWPVKEGGGGEGKTKEKENGGGGELV